MEKGFYTLRVSDEGTEGTFADEEVVQFERLNKQAAEHRESVAESQLAHMRMEEAIRKDREFREARKKQTRIKIATRGIITVLTGCLFGLLYKWGMLNFTGLFILLPLTTGIGAFFMGGVKR